MSKAHMSWPYRKRNQFSPQHYLKKEMNYFQQQPPAFSMGPRQTMSVPNWQQVEKDAAFLAKDFNLLNLNNQPPPGNRSQLRAKGPEDNLYSQYEEKVRPFIDLIDSLRALGVEQDLALPAIAVIGDQSSGKSSVLEALSGVALPRGSGIVTRCPLVLKLKKQPHEEWAGRISYRNTELKLQEPSQVEKEIHKAQNIMAGNGLGISHELITLEITSPEVADLTIIDLPGIARVAVGNQPQDIGLQIKALIKKYIQRQQTINLVVVPCNVDIATTEALSMAHEVDPEGDRTIGILTKPDLMDRGTEKGVINVVRNLTYPLKKGYMIVKCRGQQEITNNLSLAEATKKEMTFFQTHPHFRVLLEEGSATVPRLAERLTTELILHIQKSLPLLEEQIRESHQKATEELRHCGADIPIQEADKMFFLIEKIKMFNQDIEKLVEGEEVVRENETRLYNKIREEFKNWVCILAANTQKEIVQQAFINIAKKHFSEFLNLNQTAQSKIEDIKMKHAEKAESMVRLQFRMEQMVFCQDQIYSVVLKKVREEIFNPVGKPLQNTKGDSHFSSNGSSVSSITEIGVHLNAYFLETSKRLANQIPFIIQYFMLRENGDWLQKAMMQILQEKDRYSWLLQEQSETATRRRILKERIYRLAQARHMLCKFSGEGIH
uniref:Interferon-induced GTP-binding protein Mx2 n=1 Tax=Callithrix jacchus TaxID=9483 RepID=A0A8I3W7U2_CALJA